MADDSATGSSAVPWKEAPVGTCLLEGDFGQASKDNVLSSSWKKLLRRRRARTSVCRFPGMMFSLKTQLALSYLGLLTLCYHQISISWIPTKLLSRKIIQGPNLDPNVIWRCKEATAFHTPLKAWILPG